MDAIQVEFKAITQQLSQMHANIDAIRPPRPRFRLPLGRPLHNERYMTYRHAADALNHAAAFIGYFEGIAARGAFQHHVREAQPRRAARTVDDVLTYVQWVVSELLSVLNRLLDHASLSLHPDGQKKPGPARTVDVCRTHLSNLDRMIGALVYKAAPNDETRRRITALYDA